MAAALVGADVSPLHDATSRASTLIVSVGDNATGAFIPDAQVRLPAVGRVARTQWNGEARFSALDKGRYRIQVRAIGYAPSDIDMPLSGDSAGIYFALERIPKQLDTVRVAETPSMRGLQEFEARRRMGIGRFITDSILRDDRTHSVQLILTRIPGLFVDRNGVTTMLPTAFPAPGKPKPAHCPVAIYLDGFQVKDTPNPSTVDLEKFHTDDLAGIEVYSDNSAPVQYRPRGDYCRVVLLWSRW